MNENNFQVSINVIVVLIMYHYELLLRIWMSSMIFDHITMVSYGPASCFSPSYTLFSLQNNNESILKYELIEFG